MPLSSSLTEQDFIKQYWQQKPLLFRQCFGDLSGLIDGDELAGLACEEVVESRIISGFEIDGDWACQQGPFNEDDFANLSDKNWTLLVQGVEQWDEQIRSILDNFSFLPKWRLEDIMVSYAPQGGGVGPHFDYYDVFLLQVSGKRQWKLGQHCDEGSVLQANDEVKLLSEFHETESHEVVAGDMLYIPAGVAHWGTALSDDCITFSVGFRAPSEKDIIEEALENIAESLLENNRYQDTEASIDIHPYKINAAASENLRGLLNSITPEKLQDALQQAFGQLVTDTRYTASEEDQEEWTLEQLQATLRKNKTTRLYHYPHSRFAFTDTQLFVNGEAFFVDEKFSRLVCDKTIDVNLPAEQLALLVKFLNDGSIALED